MFCIVDFQVDGGFVDIRVYDALECWRTKKTLWEIIHGDSSVN